MYGYFITVTLPFSIVQVSAICPNGYQSHVTDCKRLINKNSDSSSDITFKKDYTSNNDKNYLNLQIQILI